MTCLNCQEFKQFPHSSGKFGEKESCISQRVRVWAAELTVWVQSPGSTWWKMRTDTFKLSPNLHVHAEAHVWIHVYIHKSILQGWREGSAVQSPGCSPIGPWFNSQHPPGSSRPAVTAVPGHLMPYFAVCGYCAHVLYWHTRRKDIHLHKNNFKNIIDDQ